MNTASAQLHNRFFALEQENALLRLRLQACEQSYARLQAEIAPYRRDDQDSSSLEHRLLEATATVANALLTIENFDEAVNTALKMLGESLETDRVNIIENFGSSSTSLFPCWRTLEYEWNSPGTVPQHTDQEAAQGSYEEVIEIFERLHQGQVFRYRIEDAPEPFRSEQAAIGVKSTYLVPICVEGAWWGVLGLDDCRKAKHRSAAELSMLRIAADCIGSAIQRERTQQALLQAEQARSAELAKVNEELQQRDRLLSVVPQITKNLLEAEDVEVAIPAALQAVGEATTMSRVLLILERQDPLSQRLQHCVEFEWIASGICDHAVVGMAVMDNENFQVLIQPLYAGQSIWRVIEELPEVTRSQFAKLEIQSTGVVPIFIEGHYIGCIGFDDCVTPRRWSQQEMDVLTAAAESIGAALHRKQLVDRLITERIQAEQERAAELAKANEALKRSLDSLASEPSLDKLLKHVLKVIAEQLDAPLTEYWYHPEPNNIAYVELTYWQGQILKPEEQPGHVGRFGYPVPPQMIHQESLHHRRSHFITDDIATSELHSQIAQEYGLDAGAWYELYGVSRFLNVPLILGDKTIGALIVFLPSDRHFTEQQIELSHALAQQVALAIQLTRLAEEAKQAAIAREQEKAAQERAAELAKANESLRRSLRKLANERSLDAYLEHILREALQMLDGTIAQIFLYDSDTDTLTASVGVDQQGEFLPTPGLVSELPIASSFPANITGIWQRLLNHRCAIQLDLDRDAVDFWPGMIEWHRSRGNQAILCVPMLMGDMPLGLLGLASTECIEFTVSELEFTQALVQQATLAIQLTRLAQEVKQAAIFEERNRMASEIHDTLAQAFTGISLQLEVAKSLVEQDPPTVQQILNHISQLAEAGLTEARRSVWALYPPAAEYADLAQLLYESVEQMTRNTKLAIDVNLQGSPCSLPPFIGMNLLRIGQEALTNALKHAQTQTITIELVYERDRILLTIRDNGCGFNPPTTIDPLNGGFGLIGMYERCDRIGAQLSLTSQPGQGTQILVEAPLR